MSLRKAFARLNDIQTEMRESRIDNEKIGWLGTLIREYAADHDWKNDEDPTATSEMLTACRDIHRALLDQYSEVE